MPEKQLTWLLGWQGITAEVPLSWSLSKVEGAAATGYLRLDDEQMPRLELRWAPSPPKRRDLDELTENYIRQARKLARKYRTPFDCAHKERFFPAKGREVRYLTLQSDYPSHIIVSRCKGCGRIVLARILHRADEDVRSTVAQVFGSLRDHAYQGELTWSVFDLTFKLPEAFELRSSGFLVGRISLQFQQRKDRLLVERHNFAGELLRGAELKRWLVAQLRKELRPFACSSEEWVHQEHPGLRLLGELKKWRRVGSLGFGRRLTALCWRCPASDRLYVLRVVSRTGNEAELLRCAQSIRCHEQSD